MAGGGHGLREPLAARDPFGDGAANLDDTPAGPEVVIEGDLLDVGVAIGERDDVRYLAAAPLVDRLVVVPDDAQVRTELDEPADETFLERVDVLVLVDDDVLDVVLDVVLDAHVVIVLVRVTFEVVTAMLIICV